MDRDARSCSLQRLGTIVVIWERIAIDLLLEPNTEFGYWNWIGINAPFVPCGVDHVTPFVGECNNRGVGTKQFGSLATLSDKTVQFDKSDLVSQIASARIQHPTHFREYGIGCIHGASVEAPNYFSSNTNGMPWSAIIFCSFAMKRSASRLKLPSFFMRASTSLIFAFISSCP